MKLLYTRTYSDGTQIEGIDIGGSWSCCANCFSEGWRCQGWDNDVISAPELDYTGRDYKYNVVSGKWQIKACGQKGWSLLNVEKNFRDIWF